jgi:TonB family protein
MTSLLSVSNLFAWSAQIIALVAVALVTLHVVRIEAPAVRYVFLRAILIVSLALPFAQPHTRITDPSGSVSVASVEEAIGRVSIDTHDDANSGAFDFVSGTSALAGVLIGGTLIRLGWMAVGILRLRRLRRAGEVAPESDDQAELLQTIGVRAVVRDVAGLGQPVTFGFRRPVVLLPTSLRVQPLPIQRAVLAHELWHVKRRDWIWTVSEETLRAVFWFNPAVWALLSRIQAAREEVVDELTILTTGSRRSYADALLAFADARPLFAATAFARRKHLVHRMVLISKEAVMSGRRVVISGAVLAVALMSAGWYAVQAFPLTTMQTGSGSEIIPDAPGPVERRAKPVTPENPVPQRTHSVNPDYPSEALDSNARGVIFVRAAVDETGRVAEARVEGFSLRFYNDVKIAHSNAWRGNFETLIKNATFCCTPDGRRESYGVFRGAIEALGRSATTAVGSWSYAPPADGPIAFTVTIAYRPQESDVIPPPPPPPPPPGQQGGVARGEWNMADGAIRVGENIKPPAKTRNVAPEYPPIAQAAGVQGVVIIEARIERNGTVSATRVLRSIPLLDEAALAAVQQWQFTPTLLNGQPVPVIMTTTVNFTLQ